MQGHSEPNATGVAWRDAGNFMLIKSSGFGITVTFVALYLA
jgi:hypothetical protein